MTHDRSTTLQANDTALVRVGASGQLLYVQSDNSAGRNKLHQLSRGDRVVVELECGQSVAKFVGVSQANPKVSGSLIRRSEPQDELRIGYLQRFAQEALELYNSGLSDDQKELLLLGAEPMLDGKTLLLTFLASEVPADCTAKVFASVRTNKQGKAISLRRSNKAVDQIAEARINLAVHPAAIAPPNACCVNQKS